MTGKGLDHMLQDWLRRVIAADTELASGVGGLAGTSALLLVENTDLCLRVEVSADAADTSDAKDADGLVAVRWAEADEDSDVFLSVPMHAVMAGLRNPNRLPSGATVRGDVELLGKWRTLLAAYRPDIEQLLADKFGDDIACAAARALEIGRDSAVAVRDKLRRDIADAMARGNTAAISPEELRDFASRVDELRNKLEWLRVRSRDEANCN